MEINYLVGKFPRSLLLTTLAVVSIYQKFLVWLFVIAAAFDSADLEVVDLVLSELDSQPRGMQGNNFQTWDVVS